MNEDDANDNTQADESEDSAAEDETTAANDSADESVTAAEPEPPVDDGVPRKYDFTHPQHRLNKPLTGLTISANKVAVDLTTRIENTLHISSPVTVTSSELRKHKDIATKLETGTCVFRIALTPIKGNGYMVLSPQLVFMLVQGFFGGSQTAEYEPVTRPLSVTEIRLASRLRDTVIEGLMAVWGNVLQFSSAQANPVAHDQFAAESKDAPVVAALEFQLAMGDNTAAFSMLFPYEALDVLHRSSAPQATDSDNSLWLSGLKQQLVGCELDIHGVLAETTITVRQLLKLQAGDFIPLGNIQTATFSTGTTPLFEAQIGASNGRVSASLSHWHGQRESIEGAASHDYFGK